MLMPAKPVPDLTLPTVYHDTYTLSAGHGPKGTVLVFYRGNHCPICMRQLREIEEKLPAFAELDVRVVAVSGDGEDRARETAEKAGVSDLKIAYGLATAAARDDWGLWISSARDGSAEPPLFSEPGHFYITPDNHLYFGWVQTSPFARPQTDDILSAIRYQQEKDYPPRGMHHGPV